SARPQTPRPGISRLSRLTAGPLRARSNASPPKQVYWLPVSAFLSPAAALAPALTKHLHEGFMVKRPAGSGALEFAVVSGLRAAQLIRGCTPRVEISTHKVITTAQLEVAAGKIVRLPFVAPDRTL